MKVYNVNANDGQSTIYFATKSAAMKEARRAAREYTPAGEHVEVEEVTLVPVTKAVVVRLINGEGAYVDAAQVIARIPSRRKETA